MSTSPNNGDEKFEPPSSSTVILLMSTLADTTWRLFVPSVGMTLLGLAADSHFGTKPWLLVSGAILGCALAYLLVRSQMKKVDTKK